MEQSSFIKINPADSVVVCLRPMKKGETIEVDGKTITLLQDTPAGHKVLINDAAEGTDILKYGYPIGHAKTSLKAGEWVNENNLKTNLAGTLDYTYNPVDEQLNIAKENRTFKGYVRKNGEVGVRNEIWVVPTVGCVNGVAEKLVELLKKETGCEGIDAIHAWHHNFGCSQLSGDHENTRKVLRDICLHPNAGAVLVLSLGCENNQPDDFMKMLGDYDHDRIKLLVTQKVEGDELEEGMKILRNLYALAKEDKREEVPITSLNYLSTMALERAGIALPSYNQFLADMQQTIPAINSRGYYSVSSGCFKHLEEAVGEEAEWIDRYQILQYNNMFDKKKQSKVFFPYLQN